jgi:hypothetical protein
MLQKAGTVDTSRTCAGFLGEPFRFFVGTPIQVDVLFVVTWVGTVDR